MMENWLLMGIQLSYLYEDGENQFDILKEDALEGIKTTYYDEYDKGHVHPL